MYSLIKGRPSGLSQLQGNRWVLKGQERRGRWSNPKQVVDLTLIYIQGYKKMSL